MHKCENKSFKKVKEKRPSIEKWQDEWIWEPVALDPSDQRVSSKFIGKILNDDIYECGFCGGRGEKPHGTRCSVCAGKGAVSVILPAVICAYCKGSGEEKRRSNLTCTVCRGKGVIHVQEPIEKCSHCHGTGAEQTNKLPCMVCRGSGVVTVKEEAGEYSCSRRGHVAFSGERGIVPTWGQSMQEKLPVPSKVKPRKKSYCLPSGSEKKVLEIIYELGVADSVTLGRRMKVSPSYAGYLCKSLIKAGLLIWDSGKYTLTTTEKKLLEKR